MRTDFFCGIGEELQKITHPPLEEFANTHPRVGKLGTAAIVALDFTVATFGTPLVAIERAALLALNLLGAAFSRRFSLEDAAYNAKELFRCVVIIPFESVIIFPIKFAYHVTEAAFGRIMLITRLWQEE